MGEQKGCLRAVEREIRGAELGQSVVEPQPLQRQRRVGARGDHEVEVSEAAPRRLRQRRHRRAADQPVQVVEDQRQGPGLLVAGAEEPGDEPLVRAGWGSQLSQGGDR